MTKKILVTGGAGFIGSAVVRHIIENTQDSVVNVDKLAYAGNLESLESVENNPRYDFEQVDICDAKALARLFEQHQPDAVMHLAAESHVDRSIDGPAAFIETNIMRSYTLLEASRAYWNTLSDEKKAAFRFHHISTDVVRTICALLEELVPNKPKDVAKYEDLITYVKDRQGHDVRYAIDATKIGHFGMISQSCLRLLMWF